MDKIKSISFPNTAIESEQGHFHAGQYFFKVIQKNGEMAQVNWIEVWEGQEPEGAYKKKVAEIRESVCNIWFI